MCTCVDCTCLRFSSLRIPQKPKQKYERTERGKLVTLWRDVLCLPMAKARGFPCDTR
jgi:hypothetical protein